MKQSPEFDRYSSAYDALLKDPIRDRFTGNESRFFHERKSELIRKFFQRRTIDTTRLSYLDVGCGKGELVSLLRDAFGRTAACDVSAEMMSGLQGVETRIQTDSLQLPFGDAEFDFVTAVCVYHHVPMESRPELTNQVARVLRPGGIFCMIEHNPLNPVTRLIVSRTPVDSDAVLLGARESSRLAAEAGLDRLALEYFLYFPKRIYQAVGGIEVVFTKVPLGGQYAVFSRKAVAKVRAFVRGHP